MLRPAHTSFFFFFNDTATTEIYTLSLHDALPICRGRTARCRALSEFHRDSIPRRGVHLCRRSEEHTSELQSRLHLVCRLLLEKKKKRVCRTSLCTHHTATDSTGSHSREPQVASHG